MSTIDVGKATAVIASARDGAALRGELEASGALTLALSLIAALVDDRMKKQNGEAKAAGAPDVAPPPGEERPDAGIKQC